MLKDKLQELIAKSASKVPEAAKSVMAASTQAVADSIAGRSIPAIGQLLPEFVLPDSQGTSHRSVELVKDSHVILTFFRGGW